MTRLRHLFDHRLEGEAVVLSVNPPGAVRDDDRPSVTLSETLFQDETDRRGADRGAIGGTPVVRVLRSPTGEVSHHFPDGPHTFRVGGLVRFAVDLERRHFLARLQCAGRLVELAAQEAYRGMRVVDSRYKPHQAFVEFGDEGFPSPDAVEEVVPPVLRDFIRRDLPVTLSGDPAYPGSRRVRVGDFPPFPYDGVFPRSLGEVGSVVIHRVHVVGGRLRVCYAVSPPAPASFVCSVAPTEL